MSKFVVKVFSREFFPKVDPAAPDDGTWNEFTDLYHADTVQKISGPNFYSVIASDNHGGIVVTETIPYRAARNTDGRNGRFTTMVVIENSQGKTTEVIKMPEPVSL